MRPFPRPPLIENPVVPWISGDHTVAVHLADTPRRSFTAGLQRLGGDPQATDLVAALARWLTTSHHRSISHHLTKGRQREIILQTSLQVTQPPRKPRHGAAVEFSEAPMVGIGLGVGFFSSGVGQCNVSSRPTGTHQYIANAMIKIRRSRRFACSSCEVCRSKPWLLKSENVGSIAQRAP